MIRTVCIFPAKTQSVWPLNPTPEALHRLTPSFLPPGNSAVLWQQYLIFSLSKNHTGKLPEFPSTVAFANRLVCPLQAQALAGTQAPISHLAETEAQQKPGQFKFQPRINPAVLLTPVQTQCTVALCATFFLALFQQPPIWETIPRIAISSYLFYYSDKEKTSPAKLVPEDGFTDDGLVG